MKKALLSLLLTAALASHAADPTPVTSRITAVTVFLTGAQVTRLAKITLPVGETQYRLEKLSPYVDAQSIRVRAAGDLMIKSVFYQRNYLDSTQQSEEDQALMTRMEELRRQIARQEARLAVLEEEEALLIANRTLGGRNESVTTAQLEAVADFFRERLTELKQQQTTLRFAIEDLKSEQQRLQQQRNGLSPEPEEPSGEIVIMVRAEKSETVDLEVSYTVAQAGWYPTYEYFTAPKVSKEVFLTALITDWAPYNLMASEASIFFEDTFVGRSVLDVDQLDDTLTVSLGQDRSISVSRTRVADYSEKNFFGTTRSEQVGYEIALRSNKAQPVSIVVEDQIPVSTNEQIRVDVEETSSADYNEATGLLRWSLELPAAGDPAAETKKLRFGYEVKYPKNQRVVLD
ncbi:MAG: DUF4139 domain-containing protein [Tunicatimonas sp.]